MVVMAYSVVSHSKSLVVTGLLTCLCYCNGIKQMVNERRAEENQSGGGFDPCMLNKSRIESNRIGEEEEKDKLLSVQFLQRRR